LNLKRESRHLRDSSLQREDHLDFLDALDQYPIDEANAVSRALEEATAHASQDSIDLHLRKVCRHVSRGGHGSHGSHGAQRFFLRNLLDHEARQRTVLWEYRSLLSAHGEHRDKDC
jgi:hypothetical protein